MSVENSLFETQDIFAASVICYLWGTDCLARIKDVEAENRRRTTMYCLAVPVDEATVVASDYYADKDSLTILPRAFVGAYNSIMSKQRAMRHRGDDEWCSPDWIAGRVG